MLQRDHVRHSSVEASLGALLSVLAFSAVACASSSPSPTLPSGPIVTPEHAVTPEPAVTPEHAVTARETEPMQDPAIQEYVHLVSAELGRAISEDWTLTDPTTVFGVHDTIYVLITTRGSAQRITLSAHWTYQDGQSVSRDDITITPNGTERTEFHVSNPAGWPPGEYQVEILLDGRSVETLDFEVSG